MYTLKHIQEGKCTVIIKNGTYSECMDQKIKILTNSEINGLLIIHSINEKKNVIDYDLLKVVSFNMIKDKLKIESIGEMFSFSERKEIFNMLFSPAKFAPIEKVKKHVWN